MRENVTTVYKLTDQNLETYNYTKWVIGEWKTTNGEGELCGPGWLHCYSDPFLAVFFNPVHGEFDNPRLFEAEVTGEMRDDYGHKQGWTRMRLVREIPLPILTIEQRVEIAIRCAKQVSTNPQWNEWADNWLSGEDRSLAASKVSSAAAWAASAAAAAWATEASAASWASAAAVEAAWASVASAASEASEAWAAYEAARTAAWAVIEAKAVCDVKGIIYQVVREGTP